MVLSWVYFPGNICEKGQMEKLYNVKTGVSWLLVLKKQLFFLRAVVHFSRYLARSGSKNSKKDFHLTFFFFLSAALCKLMDATISPQQLFEKMQPAFTHKNGKVTDPCILYSTLHTFKSLLTLKDSSFVHQLRTLFAFKSFMEKVRYRVRYLQCSDRMKIFGRYSWMILLFLRD